MTLFRRAFDAGRAPLIMEVKLQDGNGQRLLADELVEQTVDRYVAASPTAISVVTGSWFGGNAELLERVRGRTSLPVLCKDFITRRSQVQRCADAGADALLLTAQLLPAQALTTLVDAALDLGVTPFVEVVDEAEVAAVPRPQECVIAVNNKSIKIAERDDPQLDRSFALVDHIFATGCRIPVSASGIDSPETGRRLLASGYRGLLVGTSLLAAPDLADWARLRPHGAEVTA